MRKYLMLLLLILILYSCDKNPTRNEKSNYSFAMYFLSDTTLKIQDVHEIPINELKLQNKPWISEDDIEFYDWSSHCIYLNNNKKPKLINNFEIPINLYNRPYIVTANDMPEYLGYIGHNPYYDLPYISSYSLGYYFPEDIILIGEWPRLFVDYDPRNNINVKDALINSELVKEGIQVEIDTASLKIVERSDSIFINYSLVITNSDNEDIYIFDPSKCGYEIYNAYNWLVILNMNTLEVYFPISSSDIETEWGLNWYKLVKSGDSISLDIHNNNFYKGLPNGDYLIQTTFSAPIIKEKEKRETIEGRVWIGDTKSPVYKLEFEI